MVNIKNEPLTFKSVLEYYPLALQRLIRTFAYNVAKAHHILPIIIGKHVK